MPKYKDNYDEEDYENTNGDSFGSIFRDFVVGATASTKNGGGWMNDLIEFLETSSGIGGGSSVDSSINSLLQTGTLQEIGNEMEDTELVVEQLTTKLDNLQAERVMIQGETMSSSSRYMDQLQQEEQLEELTARQTVVQGYLKRARKRLLQLQTRYKEMIMQGQDDTRARRRSERTATTNSNNNNNNNGAGSSTSSSTSQSTSSSSSSTASYNRPKHDKPEDAWKDDSFGSFGRRGSGRRRSSSSSNSNRKTDSTSTTSPSSSSSSSSNNNNSSSNGSTASRSSYSSNSNSQTTRPTRETLVNTSSSTSANNNVPPHRRSSADNRNAQNDLRRLRELKVDEEFEKLKKELGL